MERGPDDGVREAMAAKVRTPEGAALYRQRKGIVEPVFGILKEVLGFRQFSRRGLAAVTAEFALLALAYNIKILARGTRRGGLPGVSRLLGAVLAAIRSPWDAFSRLGRPQSTEPRWTAAPDGRWGALGLLLQAA